MFTSSGIRPARSSGWIPYEWKAAGDLAGWKLDASQHRLLRTRRSYGPHGMSISGIEISEPVALSVHATDDALTVDLADGRTITVPLAWFPRLLHGTAAERSNWRLIGSGQGIHWPALDEDISVASLLAGRRSSETQESLARWLRGRETR